MIAEFNNLNKEESQLMYDAVPLITLLIAAADGAIESEEIEWAEKVTQIRSYSYEDQLREYYEKVGNTYSERLETYMKYYKENEGGYVFGISSKLEEINKIMPKIDFIFRQNLYKSWQSFALHVAKATGGFLGFRSIQKEERELVDLPMIDPN